MLYRNFKEEEMRNLENIKTVEGIPPLTLPKSKGKSLKDYKIYGNSYQRLPQEYQEVEYIESTGTQWIDTGVKQDKLNIDIKFMNLNDVANSYGFVLGGRQGPADSCFVLPIRDGNYHIVEYGTSSSFITANSYNTISNISNNKNVFTYNGTTYTLTPYTFSSAKQYNVYIFSCNDYNIPLIRTSNKSQII